MLDGWKYEFSGRKTPVSVRKVKYRYKTPCFKRTCKMKKPTPSY
jgi:hypothetical protein